MVFRHISPDMKQRALQLLQQCWDMKDIVEALGVSERSIANCWTNNFANDGHVVLKTASSLQGRRCNLNAAAISDLQ
jgi:hypothetical protein